MNKISSVLTNFDAPSAGFSEGELKDDPGDGSGSGVIKAWIQDPVYACYALAKKYIGTVSDTPESETASDVMDSIETMTGVKNPNTAKYDNSTTYNEDDHVMRFGIQFVSMEDSNTGNTPFSNLDKWLPCFNRDDVMVKWRNGENISGGFENLHNFRDAGYRQLFGFGKYNFGGDAGSNYQATGVHLDGTVVTGDTTLENLFDVGGGDEYHLLDVIAPDVLGTRTLLDVKGRVAVSVDAGGGDREIVGLSQDDAIEDHTHKSDVGFVQVFNTFTAGAVASPQTGTDTGNITPASANVSTETRMKNYSVGITSIIVMQELP